MLAPPSIAFSAPVAFEIRRKLIHVFVGLAAVPVLLYLPFAFSIGLAALAVAVVTFVHYVRKWRVKVAPSVALVTDPLGEVLDKTRRPHEDYPWAPVTFAISLVIIATIVRFAALPAAFAFASFGILGVGDAASALIGVAYGKHKLLWNRKKSWEGLLAGLVAGFLAASLLASVYFAVQHAVLPVVWLGIALAGALVGAFVESLPRLEDNLTVPIASFGAMLLVAFLLGIL